MEEDENDERWELILKLLKHLKSGDSSKQIPRTKLRDQLEEMIELINMEVQEFESGLKRLAYVHPDKAYLFVAQMSITLDPEFRIISITEKTEKILNYSAVKLIGRLFKSILQPSSVGHWQKLESLLRNKKLKHNMITMDFKTGDGLKVPAQGTLSFLKGDGNIKYMFTSYKAVVYTEHFSELDPWLWQKKSDKQEVESIYIRRSEKVREYIMMKLRDKTIDLDSLTEQFRIGRQRLIKEFKLIYGLTPFQYHKHERMTRIKILIEQTDISLKEIALDHGYQDYKTFSKEFKKKFKKTPSKTRAEARKK